MYATVLDHRGRRTENEVVLEDYLWKIMCGMKLEDRDEWGR